MAEHKGKLAKAKQSGGHTSKLETEIRNFEKELKAIDEVLEGSK